MRSKLIYSDVNKYIYLFDYNIIKESSLNIEGTISYKAYIFKPKSSE